ncbi:MAG: hypothetical protein DCO81_05820 [Candidatus Aquiluna sp. XM-24bin5]|nr:MAG: hypothetical protein DCO81_05820 [Candidatus Aquiluna sp. XM-24bin5]
MSNNKFRKGLALLSGTALASASLIAGPAANAAGGFDHALASGSSFGMFSGEGLRVDFAISPLLAEADLSPLWAANVTSAESTDVSLTFHDLAATDTVDYVMYDSRGVEVAAATLTLDANRAVVIPFAANDGVSATLYNLEDAANADLAALSDITVADDDLGFGDGGNTITLQQWIEEAGTLASVDSKATSVATFTVVDPASTTATIKATRTLNDTPALDANDAGDAGLYVRVTFNKDVNLDQMSSDSWVFGIEASDGDGDDATAAFTADFPVGQDSFDDLGHWYGLVALDAQVMDAGNWYKASIAYDAVGAKTYNSSAFTVPVAPTDADVDVDGVTVDLAASAEGNAVIDGDVTISTGTDSVTYVATTDDGGTAVTNANSPVIAVITAGDYMPTGASITVAGSADSITAADQAMTVSGLTNADGEFSITVTYTGNDDAVEYDVDFYAITEAGAVAAADNLTATYADAAVDTAVADTAVLSGANLTLSVDFADQFGNAVSENADGALKVVLYATDTDDLEIFAPVVGGTADFSFANFLTGDEVDTLTWATFTGDDADYADNLVAGLTDTVTLYSARDVYGINVGAATLDTSVVYEDFVTGDEAFVQDGDKVTVSGTVIDENGGGVPGAQVTISGAGLQFENSGDYTIGSITVTADEGGAFEADVWTHVASATGVDITVTSGGASATVEMTSAVPSGAGDNSAANYSLTWNVPATVVVDTTYAITATMADKWGNPLKNADLEFLGTAAAEFNGSGVVVEKTTNSKGQATVYLRSLEGVTGLSAIQVQVVSVDVDGGGAEDAADLADTLTDNEDTAWDESLWSDTVEAEINFLASAPAATGDAGSDSVKVNAGSFKGYVAIYAKGYEGKRLSAKVGADWVVVPTLASNFERVVEFTGAGYTIAVRIYIDRVLVDTITVTTK